MQAWAQPSLEFTSIAKSSIIISCSLQYFSHCIVFKFRYLQFHTLAARPSSWQHDIKCNNCSIDHLSSEFQSNSVIEPVSVWHLCHEPSHCHTVTSLATGSSRVTCLISCQSMNLCNSVFRTRTPSSSSRQHQELFAITYTAAAEIWKWVSFHNFMAFIRNAQLSAAVVFVHNIWESLGLINVSTSRNFNLFVWEQNCYSWPDHQTLLFISDPKHLLLCFEVPVDFIQLHLLRWRLVCSTMFDVCCCRLWSLEQDAEHPQPGPHIFVQQV